MADETSESRQEQQPRQSSRGEWVKFGILVVILIGVVGVVALSRPLIFGRIVPAVMGGGEEAAAELDTRPIPAEAAPSEAYPAETEGAGDNELFIPVASGSGDETAPADAPESGEEEDGGETAVPPADPTPVTYTVQTGDTLLKISRQFTVDVNALMAANDIGNADFIYVGQVLIIPAK